MWRCEERFYWVSDSEIQTWNHKRVQSCWLIRPLATKNKNNMSTYTDQKTQSVQWAASKTSTEQTAWSESTYTFKVEMRQRHSPSLVLMFLCLKPHIIHSHTNWRDTNNLWSPSKNLQVVYVSTGLKQYLRFSSLVHDLQEQRLVLVLNLVLVFSQSIYEAGHNWGLTWTTA